MAKMKRKFLLLDLDGVILDLEKWDSELECLAEPAFVSLLGGEAAAWIEHQHKIWLRVWQQGCTEYKEEKGLRRLNLARWWDRLHAQWIAETCAAVGVEAPATFEERVDAAERALTYVYQHTNAVFSGAASTIVTLSRGFELHMASGNPAWIIEAVLERLGVRAVIGEPFGSDLIGFQKGHERFYPDILEAVGARPEETIVVDDGEGVLARAGSLGIMTVKVGADGEGEFDLRVDSISELPALIDSLEQG